MTFTRLVRRDDDDSPKKPTFHHAPEGIEDIGDLHEHSPILFGVSVACIVAGLLFLIGLVVFVRKEANRQKAGQKPRWGIAILKALTVPTLLFIPIQIFKQIRKRSSNKKYTKLEENQGHQTHWYGSGGHPYAGAAGAAVPMNNMNPMNIHNNHSPSMPAGPIVSQPYDFQPTGAAPTPYGLPSAAHYDAPASLPAPIANPGVPSYHQPPPREKSPYASSHHSTPSIGYHQGGAAAEYYDPVGGPPSYHAYPGHASPGYVTPGFVTPSGRGTPSPAHH